MQTDTSPNAAVNGAAAPQQNALSPANLFAPNRYLGTVTQMSKAAVRMSFVRKANATPAPCDVGGYLVLSVDSLAILGQLMDLEQSEDASKPEVFAIGTVQMLTTIDLGTGKVISGVAQPPRIGTQVYAAEPSLVELVLKARRQGNAKDQNLTFSFARLARGNTQLLDITPEMLFGRHCLVLGTTGSGKSWTVAKLTEESAKFRSKVILFDPTGEYSRLSGSHIQHCILGNDPNPQEDAIEVSVPYFHLTENDLFAIFKPGNAIQTQKLRSAIKSLKLALLSPSLALDGVIIKANKSKVYYESEYNRYYHKVEQPDAVFDISRLPRQIDSECVKPTRSAFEQEYWGDINPTEQATCVPLIHRIQDIIFASHLSAVFRPGDRQSLLEVFEEFFQSDKRVLRVSMQYLSFAHGVREIIANALGRHLMSMARSYCFKTCPTLLILDEAHQFLNQTVSTDNGAFPLDAFAIMAKEGRKYGFTICLATQRPRDLPEGVISQMGTLVVHRLINDLDRGVVERASGDVDKATMSSLPLLGPGEAVLLGIDFPMPLPVRIERPQAEPNSEGPNYQRYWK